MLTVSQQRVATVSVSSSFPSVRTLCSACHHIYDSRVSDRRWRVDRRATLAMRFCIPSGVGSQAAYPGQCHCCPKLPSLVGVYLIVHGGSAIADLIMQGLGTVLCRAARHNGSTAMPQGSKHARQESIHCLASCSCTVTCRSERHRCLTECLCTDQAGA